MEHKKSTSRQSKPSQPSVIRSFLFLIINLLLLSLLSWFLLEAWFCKRIIFNQDCSIIQQIINHNLAITENHHVSIINNSLQALIAKHTGVHVIDIMLSVVEITITRMSVFIEWIPFMIAIMCVLIIDGLALRDIRKFQGARESTFLFHRLQPLAKLSFFTLFFVYMVIPFDSSPTVFILSMILLSGLFTTLAIKTFKKYL
jgi:hypothetical protein